MPALSNSEVRQCIVDAIETFSSEIARLKAKKARLSHKQRRRLDEFRQARDKLKRLLVQGIPREQKKRRDLLGAAIELIGQLLLGWSEPPAAD